MKRLLTRTRLRAASAWGVKSVMTQLYLYRRHLGSYSLIALQSCRYPRLQWLTAATKRQAWMFSPNTDPTVPHALCCLIVNNQPFTHQRFLQHFIWKWNISSFERYKFLIVALFGKVKISQAFIRTSFPCSDVWTVGVSWLYTHAPFVWLWETISAVALPKTACSQSGYKVWKPCSPTEKPVARFSDIFQCLGK